MLAGLVLCALTAVPVGLRAAPGDATPWYTVDDAGRATVHLYFFWSSRCPHCLRARPFVERLGQSHGWLRVHDYEVSQSRENVQRYLALADALGEQATSVPAFIFCNRMLVGYDDAAHTGAFLEEALLACRRSVEARASGETAGALPSDKAVPGLPSLGSIDPAATSLPVLTLLIAGMDAFNPCAFFVLLFLLSLLVHAGSRERMLLVGGVFVLCSGLVYFVFMAAWLNVFLILGELRTITVLAGILAIVIALTNIKDFFWFGRGVSLTIPKSGKAALYRRMRGIIAARSVGAMLIGTVALAFVANSYELLCTVGFPMVYTRILTLQGLTGAGYYLYLAAYNVIYVIPLAVIVVLFALALGARKLSEREGRSLKLVSGLMMLGLGLVLVMAPELLSSIATGLALLTGAVLAALLIAWLERRAHRAGGARLRP